MRSHSHLLHEETKGQACSKAGVQLSQGPVESRGNTGKNGPGTAAGKLMRLEPTAAQVRAAPDSRSLTKGHGNAEGPARAQGLGAQRGRTETGECGDF